MSEKKSRLLSMLLMAVVLLTSCRTQPVPQAELPTAISLGGGEPKDISSDGKTLAVIRTLEDVNELWLIDTDAATSEKIFEFTLPFFASSFSPDGNYLVWATDALWLAQADGNQQQNLLSSEEGIGPLTWSPSGQEIAFIESETIRAINLQGVVRDIAPAPESVRSLLWTEMSDGAEVLYCNSFPAEAPAFVAKIDLASGQQQELAAAEFFELGDERLFLSDPFEQGKLWTVNAVNGTEEQVVLQADVQAFAVRPTDSSQVAVLQVTGEYQYELALMDVNGRKLQQLTRDSLAISPIWAPDGKTLYFALFDLEAPEDMDDPFTVMKVEVK